MLLSYSPCDEYIFIMKEIHIHSFLETCIMWQRVESLHNLDMLLHCYAATVIVMWVMLVHDWSSRFLFWVSILSERHVSYPKLQGTISWNLSPSNIVMSCVSCCPRNGRRLKGEEKRVLQLLELLERGVFVLSFHLGECECEAFVIFTWSPSSPFPQCITFPFLRVDLLPCFYCYTDKSRKFNPKNDNMNMHNTLPSHRRVTYGSLSSFCPLYLFFFLDTFHSSTWHVHIVAVHDYYHISAIKFRSRKGVSRLKRHVWQKHVSFILSVLCTTFNNWHEMFEEMLIPWFSGNNWKMFS